MTFIALTSPVILWRTFRTSPYPPWPIVSKKSYFYSILPLPSLMNNCFERGVTFLEEEEEFLLNWFMLTSFKSLITRFFCVLVFKGRRELKTIQKQLYILLYAWDVRNWVLLVKNHRLKVSVISVLILIQLPFILEFYELRIILIDCLWLCKLLGSWQHLRLLPLELDLSSKIQVGLVPFGLLSWFFLPERLLLLQHIKGRELVVNGLLFLVLRLLDNFIVNCSLVVNVDVVDYCVVYICPEAALK